MVRPKKADFVFPQDVYRMALTPFAKQFGMRYIPQNPKLIVKSLIAKIAAKSRDKTANIEPILEQIKDIITPYAKYVGIFGSAIQPFLALIPPQYQAILIAIIAALILIPIMLPLRFMSIFVYYLIEKYLKIPFVWKTKRWYDQIPDIVKEKKYEFTKVELYQYDGTLYDFFKLTAFRRDAYFYEAPSNIQVILKSVLIVLEKYPEEQWPNLLDEIKNSKTSSLATIQEYLAKTVSLQAHFYSGKRTVFPPVMQTIFEWLGKAAQWVYENQDALSVSVVDLLKMRTE